MSETLSQDPETLGPGGYGLASNYPPTPATPSSTVQDPPGSNLPPFSTFSADMDTATGFSTDRFLSDTRLLDISNWDYYPETRILDRSENGLSIISSQPQYRPWESKPVDSTSQQGFAPTTPVTTFADAFTQNGVSKLPSFQSQFQTYNEAVTTSEPTLTTLTNLTPVSPNSSSPSLTTLNSNFHTLSAVNPRNYPLVPAPIQAREIPSIQQQFLDERHIQLYTHPTANIASLNPPPGSIFQSQNGAILQNSQLIGSPTVVTVIKTEPDLKLTTLSPQDMKIQNLHPTQFQNPMTTILDNNGLYNGLDKKLNGINATASSPTRNDFRKKERRKIRASSLESSAESDGASSNMDLGSESSGQVAAVSSTASFKTHHAMPANSLDVDDISGGGVDKQVKKKRKRCGECIGCQRKDNCGDCAPCRNDKSHQICKQRRCEKLTEKKNLYGDQTFMRGESRRGRGKGRGSGSYRGRKPSGPVSLSNSSVPENSAPSSRPSPQPVHMLKPEQPVQQQPMAPMPFYADPTRFSAPVWQAEPAQTWPQGQFIQQIPAPAQPSLEAYPPQQYPNGIYQATYQQSGFETNTFYTGAVQVLTNTRPPSVPDHSQLTPRTNGSYSHTPSPVPSQPPQQQGTPRSNISGQYHQEYNQGYVAPSTPTGNVDNSSRPSSVNSVVNAPTNPNFQQQQQTQSGGGFTSVSTNNFSPGSNANPNYATANSGNEKPGYPQVNSNPQLVSHSSSGYPGSNQYGGANLHQTQQSAQVQQPEQQTQQWPVNSENMMWEPNIGPGPGVKSMSMDQHEVAQQYNHSDQPVDPGDQYSQSNRVELNSRIKTMILNKHHNIGGDRKHEEDHHQQQQSQHDSDNKTGHFLWYSHHHRPPDHLGDGGGVPFIPQIPHLPPPTDRVDKSRQENYNTSNTNPLPQKNFDATGFGKNNTEFQHCTKDTAQKEVNRREQSNGMHLNANQSEKSRINVENQKLDLQNSFAKPSTPTYFHKSLANHGINGIQSSRQYPNIHNNQTTFLHAEKDKSNQSFSGNFTNHNRVPHNNAASPMENQQNMTMKLEPQSPNPLPNGTARFNGINQNEKSESQSKIPNNVVNNYEARNSLNLEPQKTPEEVKSTPTKITGTEIPFCSCFPADKLPPEPGSYYTHLGCSSSLVNLRKDLEKRTGVTGKAIRIEKVRYAGKEGKTPQGCPLAKWIIRRSSYDEKYLVVVKHRQGHSCVSAYIVICIVAWEGVGQTEADIMYSTLTDKLNKYGLPTNRRCATNEQRTCACQGLDPKTCGASFSFGCSWSMYYNGCKFARSKIVRKFRLAEKSEEQAMENRLQNLVTFLTPLYKTLAPESFKNQCIYENEASDCRLGMGNGKPFSGVTACMDFCAHTHKDSHNMNNGCTMVVTLTKEKKITKPADEQLHVLPLYTMDSTDEFGSKECQDAKMKMGSIEVLNKYECEVRIRTVPLQPCRRRKKKDDDNHAPSKKDHVSTSHSSMSSSGYESSRSQTPQTPIKSNDNSNLLQSNHVSSTVLDSPRSSKAWHPEGYLDYLGEYNPNGWYSNSMLHGTSQENTNYNSVNNPSMDSAKLSSSVLLNHQKYQQTSENTAFALTYPAAHQHQEHLNNRNTNSVNYTNKDSNTKHKGASQPAQINLTQNKVQDSHSGIIRNTNHSSVTTNNHNSHSNFGITGNVYNNNTSKSVESFKFHYSPGPVNSSPISQFKVPFTPESPIRPTVSTGFMHHNNFYKPMTMMNQFGQIGNTGYDNFLRAGGMHPYAMTSYPNHFHPSYQYNTFAPSYSLPHQFLPPNLSFESKIPRPHPISEPSFYHHNRSYAQQADIKPQLPPFHFFNNSQNINPNTYHLCNPFDDVGDYGLKRADNAAQSFDFTDPLYLPHWQYPKPWEFTPTTLTESTESLGKVIDVIDNAEAFMDSQIGGVAIALTHGSVLFECAKHELHATTALKKPNRLAPTRISLVFYQHRNLNANKHGWDQWEEKTRLKKLNSSNETNDEKFNFDLLEEKANLKMLLENNNEIMLRAPTLTTMSVTTLFPMYPCVVTGPYQKHNHSD